MTPLKRIRSYLDEYTWGGSTPLSTKKRHNLMKTLGYNSPSIAAINHMAAAAADPGTSRPLFLDFLSNHIGVLQMPS